MEQSIGQLASLNFMTKVNILYLLQYSPRRLFNFSRMDATQKHFL